MARNEEVSSSISIWKWAAGAVFLFASLIIFGMGVEKVDTGHRGVKITFGEVDTKMGSLPEGLYFYNPFSSTIKEMDVRTRAIQYKANTYTKDVQQADITYAVNYNLNPDTAHLMFRDVGTSWENMILVPVVEGAFKQVIGHWDAVDLISNREKATRAAETAVREAMKERGVNVTRLEMVNIQYQKEFEHAVEKKVTAIQKAIEEQNRTKQVQEQARQKIISAQAEAESMRIRANALVSNPKLVEYEAVQKWDGKLPQYQMSGSVPFIHLPTSK